MPLDQLDPSLFAKARAGKGRDNVQKQKEIGALEAQIYHLTEILGVSYCFFSPFLNFLTLSPLGFIVLLLPLCLIPICLIS